MAFNKKYTAKSTQTIFDLTLQLEGNTDVFALIDNNPELQNLNSDPNGIEVNYSINNTFVQKKYIAAGTTVSTKPRTYYNTLEGALIVSERVYLVQLDGYRILL